MNLPNSFIDNLTPHFPEDVDYWDLWKKQLLAISQNPSKTIFWYLSSGLDVMPLYYFTDEKQLPGSLKTTNLFLYSDYGVVFNDPENLKKMTDKEGAEKLPSHKGKFYLTKMIPLHLKQEFSTDNEQFYNGKVPTAFGGASVYLLLIKQNSPKDFIENFPILFIRHSNHFVLEYLLHNSLTVRYICTVSDGCRPDNKQQCPNEFFQDYISVLHSQGFWITDHFNQGKPATFHEIADFKDWGHYDRKDKSYCFSQKKV
ncbi:MAG: hypothetical protein K9I68_07025 [Bacteroidales bacterium]|nr:hypothetical protein [Bacteroidales bacterium]